MNLLIYTYIDIFDFLLHYGINFIYYVTCWVPSVACFAFFDGIHVSIYFHECIFSYLYFSIVLCEMKTKMNLNLNLGGRPLPSCQVSAPYVEAQRNA